MTTEDLAYLHHILDAILSIEEFSEGIGSAEDLRNRRLERAGIERMLTMGYVIHGYGLSRPRSKKRFFTGITGNELTIGNF